jgi:hypothetical protein
MEAGPFPFVMPGMKPRASGILDKCSTTELPPWPWGFWKILLTVHLGSEPRAQSPRVPQGKCCVVTAVGDVFSLVPSYISCAGKIQTIARNFRKESSLQHAIIPIQS